MDVTTMKFEDNVFLCFQMADRKSDSVVCWIKSKTW